MKNKKSKINNYEQRIDDIKYLIKSYGIYFKGYIIISLWELLFNINNTWRAEHFIDKNKIKHVKKYYNRWALEDYDLRKLIRPVKQTLLFTDEVQFMHGKNGADYLITKALL